MPIMRSLISGIQALFHKEQRSHDMDEELQAFQEASMQEKIRQGMSDRQARRAARVEMGSTEAVKHRVRASGWESTVESIWQDIRFSLRMMTKSPGFTAVAVLSLALGIGGNTAIFTLIHQVLLRDLPVQNPQQLVSFGNSEGGGVLGGIDLGSHGMFPWYFARQLQANPGPFQGIAAYLSFSQRVSVHISATSKDTSNNAAIFAPANLVSGNYFSIIGAQPFLGRAITPADDATPGSGAVVVLSYHFWQQSLSGDPAVLGKTITINSTPFTVIGVMPEAFHGIKLDLEPTELWTPITMQTVIQQGPSLLTPQNGAYFLHLFGRLSPEAATNKAALAQSQAWLDQQIRTGIRANEGAPISPARQQEINRATVPLVSAANGVSSIRSQYGDSLRILMAVVGLVLLIACANLANFLLARGASRQREIATRLALGSSHARIIRQCLIETVLLALSGGLLGLGIAFATTRALIVFFSQGNPYIAMSSKPDLTVLLFTLTVSLATGLLFGLAPALNAARTGSTTTLSSNTRTAQSSGGKASRFWPKTLVTAQVTLSLLLLVGAGLFLRTLRNLQNQDYGFERTHLLLASFNTQLAGYKPSQTPALYQTLLEHLSAIPGVRSAALSATPPISSGAWSSTIELSGYTPAPKEDMGSILNRVSGRYFETANIPIIAGRPITPTDSASSLKVAVINQAIANHFFPKGNAIGRSLTIDIDTVKGPWRIVGIARDTKVRGPRNTDPTRMTYIPLAQIEPFVPAPVASSAASSVRSGGPTPTPPEENQDRFAGTILVRTTGDPAKTIANLRAAVTATDPNLALFNITTIHDQVSTFMTDDELISSLTAIFSLLALVLASIGLYGVMSYNVVRRTNEIGIRIALGSQLGGVLWMIMKESLLLLAIGIAIGVPVTLAAGRTIQSQLFGLNATDPQTILAAILTISAVTLIAAWLPAHRATKVNPVVALRYE
ncbi:MULTISPECIES: ABC transporter permease [Acidobacteriaceae]|uniref:ABC transporter permease n=1 Tax=Acidobacteriaceae TaxID=204434 RepID=UPI00131DCB71|nr:MULTISPECIES: ABC transporter permease [Acidobacteriaceae]MDW5266194.1 ABC transporter permease [Edaphobacter sp.]